MTATSISAHEALKLANRVRFARGDFRRELHRTRRAESHALAADLLERPEMPDWATRWELDDFLLGVRHLGPEHMEMLALTIGASTNRRLGELTVSQRHRLAEELRDEVRR